MARDDCGGQTGERGKRIVHTRPVHAVMAVHTVYQSNAYRIDFNICVRKWEEEKEEGREERRRKCGSVGKGGDGGIRGERRIEKRSGERSTAFTHR